MFLPLVVKGLGYSSVQANLVSVPPYVCGAVGLYLVALSSDRHNERGYHIIFGISVTLVGLIAVVIIQDNGGKYAGLCVLLLGSYIAPPLTIAWWASSFIFDLPHELILWFKVERQHSRTRKTISGFWYQ